MSDQRERKVEAAARAMAEFEGVEVSADYRFLAQVAVRAACPESLPSGSVEEARVEAATLAVADETGCELYAEAGACSNCESVARAVLSAASPSPACKDLEEAARVLIEKWEYWQDERISGETLNHAFDALRSALEGGSQ